MAPRPLQILLVEDDVDQAELIQHALRRAGVPAEVRVTATLAAARDHLAGQLPDLVIVDFMLPDGKGTALLPPSEEEGRFPVVMITGHGDEQLAVDVIKAGASDYIVKGEDLFSRIPHIVMRTMRDWHNRLTRRHAQDALRESEERFRLMADAAQDGIVITDRVGKVVYWNLAARGIFGADETDVLGRDAPALFALDRFDARVAPGGDASTPSDGPRKIETTHRRKDGTEIIVELSIAPMTQGVRQLYVIIVRDQTARRRNEQRLRLLQFSIDHAADAAYWIREHGGFDYVNDAACRSLGYTHDELLSLAIWDVNPNISAATWPEVWDDMRQRHAATFETQFRRKDGGLMPVEVAFNHVRYEGREYNCSFVRDIVERQAIEEQLRHSQKMEAVGRFASGVAHDFNNCLYAIHLYADLLSRRLTGHDQLLRQVTEIKKAGDQAAILVQQLLAFSRQQVVETRVLDLNAELSDMEKMIKRLIGEDVALRFVPGQALGEVRADPNQLRQVIFNLAINARDAMPNGGTLTISTSNVMIDRQTATLHDNAVPGPYVLMTVNDTGTGMDQRTAVRIFEPFFTTKEVGKGTGLGLSIVHGIIKQSGGHVTVYSEPGLGSTFRIYLPRAGGAVVSAEAPLPAEPCSGGETVLLVEDELPVRTVLCEALTSVGYRVLDAENGPVALEIADRFPDPIDLLLSDVVMPKMRGPELARALIATRPGIKVILMSGYAKDAIIPGGGAADGLFLQKPCTLDVLLDTVRHALDGSPAPPGCGKAR